MALPQIQIGDGFLGDALLSSVEVVQELNGHWWCTVVCRNTEDSRIPVEELLGKPVEVKTTDDNGTERVHFFGSVHDVQLDYEVYGSYTATLVAVSDSYGMDVTAHKQYYAARTLSDVASTMAGRHGLAIAVNASNNKALNYVQYGESDWSFLHRVVDDHGAWMRPSQSGVEVFDSFQSGATVNWRGESDLLSFRLRGRRVNPSFSGSHYDHHAMQSKTFQQVNKPAQFYPAAERMTSAVQQASQKLPPGFEAQRARAMTLSDYSTQLQAESERSLGSSVEGSGSSRNQTLKAGDTLTVNGTLDAKGTYGLTRVVHQWTRQGYANEFMCTPWKQWRNPVAPVARTWNGVVPARVTGHNDPKKMGRIQVQFFWQEDGATHWARATSPHAGPDRGFMFMPEVGDEVAVAFEDGDPERPVILGALWNGIHTQPRADFRGGDVEDNAVKRLMTRSGNRVQFSDKTGVETITIATPNHNVFTLTEQADSTGRSNISLESKTGDITLSAPNGRVHILAQFYSKEIGYGGGPAKKVEAVAAPAVAAAAPAVAKEGFLRGLAGGLYSSTLAPLAHMVAHPIDTVEGIGHAIAHPLDTGKALGHAVSETARGVMSGDGRSIGTAIGTVGMFAIPGAGEASAVEDAARLGKVGELADASRVAEVGDVSKASMLKMVDASSGAEATTELPTVTDQVLQARARQQAMLDSNVGYNISPTSWDQYPTIGRQGSFVSDQQGVMKYFGDATNGEATVSPAQASQIEEEMGLQRGSLADGFKVREVSDLKDLAPRSPLEGNEFFRGPGMHLPGGAPEMVVNSVPTVDNDVVKTLLNVKVQP